MTATIHQQDCLKNILHKKKINDCIVFFIIMYNNCIRTEQLVWLIELPAVRCTDVPGVELRCLPHIFDVKH